MIPLLTISYAKKVDKVEPSRWFKLWFLAKGGFSDEIRAHWSFSNSTLFAKDSAKTQTEVEKLQTGFPHALPHKVFCDKDVLNKDRLTKGVDKFLNTTLLELLSLKHSSGEWVMPHKVSFKAVTAGKNPLARISKRKNTAAQGIFLETSAVAPAPKNSKKAPKESNLEVTPVDFEATECAHGLFLKWKESKDSRADSEAEKASLEKGLSEVLRDRDEARTQADDLRGKYEDLQAVRDGLVKYRSDLSHQYDTNVTALKTSLEESEQRLGTLRFKEGQNYKDLLIDNTISIMKTFCLKVYPDFLGIHSMFPEFVGEHFGEEYAVPLTDGEEEENDGGDANQRDDGLGEDEEDA
ncbi:hypothetical protein LIER_12941 [Lithospermum erythrorhizon]|uniref:Uncharacterized protein n=1 Tax=Lithospermum erythrorhizon TaxID=34254 RepID=A0AAV3PVP1_LITER